MKIYLVNVYLNYGELIAIQRGLEEEILACQIRLDNVQYNNEASAIVEEA